MKKQKYFIIAVCIFFAALWIGAFIFIAQDNKTNELEVRNKVNAISGALKEKGYKTKDSKQTKNGIFFTKAYGNLIWLEKKTGKGLLVNKFNHDSTECQWVILNSRVEFQTKDLIKEIKGEYQDAVDAANLSINANKHTSKIAYIYKTKDGRCYKITTQKTIGAIDDSNTALYPMETLVSYVEPTNKDDNTVVYGVCVSFTLKKDKKVLKASENKLQKEHKKAITLSLNAK